jgi:hypothetical protein
VKDSRFKFVSSIAVAFATIFPFGYITSVQAHAPYAQESISVAQSIVITVIDTPQLRPQIMVVAPATACQVRIDPHAAQGLQGVGGINLQQPADCFVFNKVVRTPPQVRVVIRTIARELPVVQVLAQALSPFELSTAPAQPITPILPPATDIRMRVENWNRYARGFVSFVVTTSELGHALTPADLQVFRC